MFKVVWDSPVAHPDSIRVVEAEDGELTEAQAERLKRSQLKGELRRWEREGSAPYWFLAPSGATPPYPKWWDEFEYTGVRSESDPSYWCPVKK